MQMRGKGAGAKGTDMEEERAGRSPGQGGVGRVVRWEGLWAEGVQVHSGHVLTGSMCCGWRRE